MKSSKLHVQFPDMVNKNNPVIFMDISFAGQPAGRLSIELFSHVVPKTAENFRRFCTGEHRLAGTPQGYKESVFHRIIKDFMIQGGDYLNRDGTGSLCAFGGESFADENFNLKHTEPCSASLANNGPNTNGC